MTQVLRHLQPHIAADERLLVGLATSDDAAVYRLDERTALVFTTDFFTPIVDDPYDWGRIAAANAFSDVYAMGARPILALNLAGWPRDDLPLDVLARVLEGGAVVAREAGALIAGGHTIDDREPKYGMAVIGLAEPDAIVTNAGARPGDVLVLTKPVGTGVVSTALKNGVAPSEVVARATETMVTLNAAAAEAMRAADARAATDVTGFGLLGHLREMAAASGVGATIDPRAVPVIEGVRALAEAGQLAGGTRRNRAFLDPYVTYDDDVDEATRWLLCDAQTSGGLLIACPPERLEGLRAALPAAAVVGTVTDDGAGISVRDGRK